MTRTQGSPISCPQPGSDRIDPEHVYGHGEFPGVLETYSFGYDWFRKESGFTPAEQEIVLLTISRSNSCTYCVATHSTLADVMSKVPPQTTDAIRNDTLIEDRKPEVLRRFTAHMMETAGNPSEEDAAAFLSAGYTAEQILAVVLAIGAKVFSNWSNHIFHTQVDMSSPSATGPRPPDRGMRRQLRVDAALSCRRKEPLPP